MVVAGKIRRRTAVAIGAYALTSGLLIGSPVALAQDEAAQEVRQDLRDMLPAHILESNTIVAAGAFDNPPSLYVDVTDTDRALGVAPELSDAIGDLLGVEFEWRNTQWPGQLPGLDARTFDVVWGQITQTGVREREVLDLVPWSQNTLGFLVEEGNPQEITDWASACGKGIAVALGSIFVEILNGASAQYCEPEGLDPINVLEYQGHEIAGIQSGQADAALEVHSVLVAMADEMAGFDEVEIPDEQVREFYSGFAGIGVSKDYPTLSTAIAEALRVLHQDGTWEDIADRHGVSLEIPNLEDVRVNPLTDTPAGEFATE